jgi:hypothetical protein
MAPSAGSGATPSPVISRAPSASCASASPEEALAQLRDRGHGHGRSSIARSTFAEIIALSIAFRSSSSSWTIGAPVGISRVVISSSDRRQMLHCRKSLP